MKVDFRIPLIILLLPACGVSSSEAPNASSTKLAITREAVWTSNSNQVPVCWDTIGYDREKEIVRNAVTRTWQFFANVDFTGWGFCPIGGERKDVRMRISPQGNANSGAGGSARVGMAALSKWEDGNPGVNFTFNPDGTANINRIEYVAIHEFGHVLGFHHEQDAPGNDADAVGYCATSGIDPDANPVTQYDRDSIMNYCNRDGNNTGNLTDSDIRGVQAIYGARRSNAASWNTCESAPKRGKVTLGAAWNDAGSASIAVFPNDGSKFLYHSQWSVRNGGWGDTVKWASGDFNGDGHTDIAAAWNNGGTNTLTVRRSTGSGFVPEHWSIGVGGWMDSTKWLAGDFNGDGRTELAGAWNNGGKLSIAVYPSNGSKFLYPKQWSDKDGGWIDDAKFMVGDFNRDGRDDIATAWNNGGRVTLTVRYSRADDSFVPAHWSLDAGRWTDSASFVAGDFNGDGRADIAELWNDIGLNSVNVSISSGVAFFPPARWATRDGGWGGLIKWVPGDYNGDGRTDIAAVWRNGNSNVLTVRASNGSSFSPSHWSTNAGGWMDTSAWCAGTF